MAHAEYLIAGSSHAALEALAAIRVMDPRAGAALVTRDRHLPYSPTILPYVVSGQSHPDSIALRDEAYFADHDVAFVRGAAVASVDARRNTVELTTGDEWHYDKLLLATGATPAVPPVPGLDEVPYYVLRTLDDALGLRRAIADARTAVVLGAGLVGTHAAENLAHAGLEVALVEKEPQMLPGYFAEPASDLIAGAFAGRGVRLCLGRTVVEAARGNGSGAVVVRLDDGTEIVADLLLVATGVRPVVDYLAGSGIEVEDGILVDDAMRTNIDNVWAAGDVAQARDFYGTGKVVTGILPDAVEQGRIAGMAMVDDPARRPYPGGVPLNTYTFFGRQAISVGIGAAGAPAADWEVVEAFEPDAGRHQKIVLRDDRLIGISAVGRALDPGIMWQLILRRTDLGSVKEAFVARPLETGRALMSKIWR